MTTDAVALFDALGLERAAVAGWSMGGFVAQSLLRRVPERIAAAALISTHTGGRDCVDAEPGVFQVLIDHSGTPREAATRFISLLFPPERAAEADAQFGEILAAGRAELPEPVLFEQEDAIVQWHGRTTSLPLADPSIPTVVVHGGKDTVVPPGNAEVLARFHPGARVEIRPECAHAPMAQEPDAVAAAILATTDRRRVGAARLRLARHDGPADEHDDDPDRPEREARVLQEVGDPRRLGRDHVFAAPFADVALVPVLFIEAPFDQRPGDRPR